MAAVIPQCLSCQRPPFSSLLLDKHTTLLNSYRAQDSTAPFDETLEPQIASDMASYITEIEHLHNVVRRLEGEREKLREISNIRRAFSAPVRRLPTEILSTIFHHCVFGSPDGSELSTLSETTCPLNISLVCTHWREIALSLPMLWTRINLDVDRVPHHVFRKIPDKTLKRVVCILDLYLQKSADLLVSIHVSYTQDEYIPDIIQTAIQRYSNRVCNLSLSLQYLIPSDISRHRMRNLRHLVCNDLSKGRQEGLTLHSYWFSNHPNLLSLDLRWNVAMRSHDPIYSVQHLISRFQTFPNLLTFIRNCVNLSELKIENLDLKTSEALPPQTPPIRSSIQCLTVDSRKCIRALATHTDTPNLKSLALAEYVDVSLPDEKEPVHMALILMLERSQCTLESFSFPCSAFSVKQTATLFNSMPFQTLRSLTLERFAKSHEPVIELLHEGSVALPHLRYLNIRGINGFLSDKIHTILSSRRSVLETVLVEFLQEPKAEDLLAIQSLRDLGFTIFFTVP